MITPRRTTLFRVPDLAAFRTTLADWILALPPDQARDTLVLVPTRAAGEQLRRTVEDRALTAARTAMVWPIVTTRRELYEELGARLTPSPLLLSAFEREVILAAVSRDLADEGVAPPFQVRPGLVAEMLALYDQIRRLGRDVEDFERNFRAELEREQDTDRGAARLMQQTVFLAAAYRGYETRMSEAQRGDEHALRARLLDATFARPLHRVIITTADRLADPDGWWPADLDLLTRLPGLRQLDLLCTEAVLAAGFLERLYAALPEIEEARFVGSLRPLPVLVVPEPPPGADAPLAMAFRDREDELIAVARRLKSERQSGIALNRTALVVRRPLPYLYLARDVFTDAAIPFETLDTLPLAAEPYAAAVDLALDAVSADFNRGSLLALLRSPHFTLSHHGSFEDAPRHELNAAIAACDFALADTRFLGGFDRLSALVTSWEALGEPASRRERRQKLAVGAARAVLDAVAGLRPLCETRLFTDQIATLTEWLRTFDRPAASDEPTDSRRQRVRGAVLGALGALAHAYRTHDPSATADVGGLTAAIRRWLGSQTFATRSGQSGLQIVDAQAARYGDFDDVQIVGLIEGEWPERVRRNVLYPSSLLTLLEPLPALADPRRRERDALHSGRAAFKDLVWSASTRVRLSTFNLENDAVVEPSILLDDVSGFGLVIERKAANHERVLYAEALALEPRNAAALPDVSSEWAAARVSSDERELHAFQGQAGAWRMPRISVSRLERYLDCPFRFYASEVLRLEEQPEDEDTRTPLERGSFLHDLWERFFSAWQRRGHGRIDPEHLSEARALFEELCEEALSTLSPSEATLERNRLLGSAVSPGIAHRVFAMEAGKPARIVERLLEYPLQGDFTFRTRSGETRVVTLSAKVDRIDVLGDGTLRVIDYKSKKTPDIKQALQLPIYSFVARESLRRTRPGMWTIAEAMYLSFEGDKAEVPLRIKGKSTDDLLDDAQDRLVQALDDIAAGRFPPRPYRKSLCGPCPYRAVCRLELIDVASAAPDDGVVSDSHAHADDER
ncbi:MAG TPA: PD-(D/E)XK nuclease family protein [Vicinamibacterales bacterium]|nr:PD-(D/E)XK nuclease family protein [Vicinamibacterales bacterium]